MAETKESSEEGTGPVSNGCEKGYRWQETQEGMKLVFYQYARNISVEVEALL